MSGLTDAVRDELEKAAQRILDRAHTWPQTARERATEYAQVLAESGVKVANGSITVATAHRDVARVQRAAQADVVLAADTEWSETVEDWTQVGMTILKVAVAAASG